MHQQLIQKIVEEIRDRLTGRYLGKIFQLGPLSFALDFGLKEGQYLFVSVDPSSPRFFLIERRARDLEKQATNLSHFGQLMRARVSGGKLISVVRDPADRVVRMSFRGEDDLGESRELKIVVQLTGKAANLFLLDEFDQITDALRSPRGSGQQPGELYQPPARQEKQAQEDNAPGSENSGSPSAAAADYFVKLDAENNFRSRANNLRARLQKALSQKRRLRANLQKDLAAHGDAEKHKLMGDLLLANVATAVRVGNKVRIIDYYAKGEPTIEIEIEEGSSLQDEAGRQFRQYTKAKRAGEEIAQRLTQLGREITELEEQERDLEHNLLERDEVALERFAGSESAPGKSQTKKDALERIPGVRRYLSSDGYEILVGRAARDNDHLTFRLARPSDLWLHAGDYPGSHVVVRNPTRKEIPHRTVIEAAQLAGHFSQASEDAKVVVHYTERKFLSKPKGSAPGLVRMSTFRSIAVEPKESVKRL
jgi:predicted ribosome quality control (RQC) complex YloA/Tae2 family protein